MTGKELAKAIRKSKGKIFAPVLLANDCRWFPVEKGEIAAWADVYDDAETDMFIEVTNGVNYLTKIE